MKTYEATEQEIHDGYLLDIAFEMRQGDIFKKLRAKHLFTDNLFWGFNLSLKQIRANKERLIDEYKRKYDKNPDIKLAKRLFLENEKSFSQSGPIAGNANYDNSRAEQNDLGD